MLAYGETVDNRTLCDLFGVGNMGGIRVNKRRSLIALVSNNTDPTYRNEWRDEILHFVGMGSIGPQKLGRQNKTLADSTRRKYAVHLFEVSRKGQYTYAGEVELAGEPYMSDQPDARAEDRFVWVFPLRKKPASTAPASADERAGHLPYGAYAVISAHLTDEQRAVVNGAMDRLKEAGVDVFDRRDVDRGRYEKALGQWWEAVLDRVRVKVKELIANRKRAARAAGREFKLVDDELRVNSGSMEAELRAALAFLDYDDPIAQEQLFDEARSEVPFPDPRCATNQRRHRIRISKRSRGHDGKRPRSIEHGSRSSPEPADLILAALRHGQSWIHHVPVVSSPSLRSGKPFGRHVSYRANRPVIVGSLDALRLRLRTALCLYGKVLSALRLTASALHRTRGTTSVVGTGSAVRPVTLCLSAQGLGTTDPTIAPPMTV